MNSEDRAQDPQEMSTLDSDVLVIGAGLSGLTAAFDLVENGRTVLLVESAAAHGGYLTLLDRQFSTDSCGFCQILPRTPGGAEFCLKSMMYHPMIDFFPSTTVEGVEGKVGAFSVKLKRHATGVDAELCTHCGRCIEVCPEVYPDPLQAGMAGRKAIGSRAPVSSPSNIEIDWEHCTRCKACVDACPEGAIRLDAEDVAETRKVGAIIVATGFRLYDPSSKLEYGYGRFRDVVTTLELERLIGKSLLEGHEAIVRPSDGAPPSRIAWIQCVGSREEKRNYCSSVCCMISLKEARRCRQLLPDAHLEIFYMDLRTCGKGYESYLNEAKDMGIRFTRERPGEVLNRDGELLLQVEDQDGGWREQPFDLIILSIGFEAHPETLRLAQMLGISLDSDGFLSAHPGFLSRTEKEGVYMAGAASEPRDIPESVIQAHEAAALAASIAPATKQHGEGPTVPLTDLLDQDLRAMVFLCDCSGTLTERLGGEILRTSIEKEPGVVTVGLHSRLCHKEGLETLAKAIHETEANALVVGACTPRWLNQRLRQVSEETGLDPNLVQVVNLREQGAWSQGEASAEGAAAAEAQLRAALARCREYRILPRPVEGRDREAQVLVVGGGPAGMSAALSLSELGHAVTLVERESKLGGNLQWIHYGLGDNFEPEKILGDLLHAVQETPGVKVLTETTVADLRGRPGAYRAVLKGSEGQETDKEFGAVVVATGAVVNRPELFHYGKDTRILTQRDVETSLSENSLDPKSLLEVVMIQCVGSRDKEHPYCSRICCASALKNALKLLDGNPGLRVVIFYRDLRAFGLMERDYRKAREKGAIFVPFEPEAPPVVEIGEDGPTVTAYDPIAGLTICFHPDRIVLSTGFIPDAPSALLDRLGLAADPEGFLKEANPKFRPLDLCDGVYGCGTALGPAFLPEAMAQGRGAAVRASGFLRRMQRPAVLHTATVQASRCSACGLCVEVCPFHARELDEDLGHAVVYAELCQACGACAAICPNDAAQLVGGTDRQILSVIEALMEA
ncbi:MAG: CoB--CoM heterodisulfide reductase iron-sulfur subunit A family protein [Deltaproteobacteria bacterium]|nr:CoB--CoM heterodisulfide reductase iron-sulfur subunit A family protein [Deltaproteobacteria bacterium]